MTFRKMEKGSFFATRPINQMSITFFLLEVGSSMIAFLKLLYGSIIPIIDKATIFLFLGLRISWPEKRVGRSEKKKKKKIPNN